MSNLAGKGGHTGGYWENYLAFGASKNGESLLANFYPAQVPNQQRYEKLKSGMLGDASSFAT